MVFQSEEEFLKVNIEKNFYIKVSFKFILLNLERKHTIWYVYDIMFGMSLEAKEGTF